VNSETVDGFKGRSDPPQSCIMQYGKMSANPSKLFPKDHSNKGPENMSEHAGKTTEKGERDSGDI